MDNGLTVIRFYQVIEYQPETFFKKLGNKVSDARCDGDRDDNCTIKTETLKLLGNAAYDVTQTNKAKHVNVAYAVAKRRRNSSITLIFINFMSSSLTFFKCKP